MKYWLLLFLIVGIGFPGFSQNNSEKVKSPLVVFLVRHAEKMTNSKDPDLSPAGKKRAKVLTQTLINSDLDGVHSSDYIRTKNTAAPVAENFGLKTEIYNPGNLKVLVEKLKKIGGRHLVVGHSNTTPEMVKLLGGNPGSEIDETSEYDRLYIVTIENKKTSTVLLRYGRKYESGN